MQASILRGAIFVLMIATFQQLVEADEAAMRVSGPMERAVVFAIQQEAKASNLQDKQNLCIGFGQGLAVDEEKVISKLKRSGLRAHANDWCNQGSKGVRISILAPINKTSAGEYELVLQVDDLSIRPGEHFATLLKRGTYVIRCEGDARPQLMSYRQTCCSKTS